MNMVMKWLNVLLLFAVAFLIHFNAAMAQDNIPIPTPSPKLAVPQDQPVIPAPQPSTPFVYSSACPVLMDGLIEANYVEALSEEYVPGLNQCGEPSPLKLTGVKLAGTNERQIILSGSPLVNCAMATRLADWAREIDGLSEIYLGSAIGKLTTGPGYQCRRRNRAKDGKISEHGFANALDVLGFQLVDGRNIDILS